jgi:hypothetical protein
MTPPAGRVALLWRGTGDLPVERTRNHERLQPVVEALRSRGLDVEHVLYTDEQHEAVRARLLTMDAVLVWVDPIDDGADRSALNTVLEAVGSDGVWVSAHPATIAAIGTKEVLVRTKGLGWGTDTYAYATVDELREQLPGRLVSATSRVLKQDRGNGGIGVWRVTLVDASGQSPLDAIVRIQHAAPRHHVTEEVRLGTFLERWTTYLEGGGTVVDQPYLASVADGMVRAYLVADTVVGFATQQPAADDGAPRDTILGLPSAKTMHPADSPRFGGLRRRLEQDWVPGLCSLVGLERGALPVLWDADFLRGPRADGYLLCEINVSSVLPFPPDAPQALADAVHRRLAGAH